MDTVLSGKEIPSEKHFDPFYVWTMPKTDITGDRGGMDLGEIIGLPERAQETVTRKEMLNQTINRMVHIADELDKVGFEKVANVLDSILKKIAQEYDENVI